MRLRNNDGALRRTDLERISDRGDDEEDAARDGMDDSVNVQVDRIEEAFQHNMEDLGAVDGTRGTPGFSAVRNILVNS